MFIKIYLGIIVIVSIILAITIYISSSYAQIPPDEPNLTPIINAPSIVSSSNETGTVYKFLDGLTTCYIYASRLLCL